MEYEKLKEKYPYFYDLYLINTYVSSEPGLDFENLDDVKEIDSELRYLYIKKENLDDVLFDLLTICGRMLGRQYFKDGNSRTIKIFIKNYLENLGYKLEINMNDYIIPMLLNNEEANVNDIEKFKDITKIKNNYVKKT